MMNNLALEEIALQLGRIADILWPQLVALHKPLRHVWLLAWLRRPRQRRIRIRTRRYRQ
jgi:hypothetical protein